MNFPLVYQYIIYCMYDMYPQIISLFSPFISVSDMELDLEGIDDDEIDRMLLRPDEISRKTQMWEKRKENIDWVKRQEEKAADELNNPEKLAKRQRQQRKRKLNRANNEGHKYVNYSTIFLFSKTIIM